MREINNRGNNSGYNGGYNGGYNNGQKQSRNWSARSGGDSFQNDRVGKIYDLLSEQAEEREERKREATRFASFEDAKKRLYDEEERRAAEKRDGKQQEIRLGQIDKDRILALQLQIDELSGIRKALEDKSTEVVTLRKENSHLRMEFKDLKDKFVSLRNGGKRTVVEVVKNSPPEAPSRGKQKNEAQANAMYTPKDMDGLYKSYKEALAGKEMSLRQAECLKERMAKAGASRIRPSLRKPVAVKRTTSRNLKTTLDSVDVDSDDEKKGEENGHKEGKTGEIVDATHELEKSKLQNFRETRMKELRTGKKHDLEELCKEEGISYIKLDQAKAGIADIGARHNFDEWIKSKSTQDDQDDPDLQYSTSVEGHNDG
ncbi:hypothetical protein CBR_g30973 [Chara braunii]|uniref:Uncharacterized protein n=1 Tax=Chara braunii TaxID=69332 RepID=A0A388LE70_CHABU|nr:hypothetical protein CBR_g30973 [Chara braunii]|eukprot:GBG80512.1 hypothetical protein CBR_g30973 [Chara braunii]